MMSPDRKTLQVNYTIVLPTGQKVTLYDKESADALAAYLREVTQRDAVPVGKTRVKK